MERQRLQGPTNSSFPSIMTEHPNYTFPSMEDDEQSKLNPFPLPLMQEQSFQLPPRLQHQKLMTMMMMMMPTLEHQSLSSVTSNNEMVIEYESYKTQNQISQIDQITSGAAGRKPRKRTDVSSKERKKRKRPTMKNKEQVESQRMTHIAVERNRRRLMNEHLNVLRSLMPPPYSQKGDQASVVGGAIDFVKELEQLLQSLEAQKRIRHSENNIAFSTSSSTSSSSNMLSSSLMESSPSSSSTTASSFHFRYSGDEELSAETKTGLAEIEVLVIQNHVNLKIQGQRRPGQLLKTIVALENLRLSVLHLSITSLHSFLHYSFNLKMEDECKLGSAEEVAVAVHQIFSFINSG